MSTPAQPYIELSADHTYYVDGERFPSVTQILKLAGLVDDHWFTEFGRWRGSAVHKATHYFDEGDMDRRTLDPIVKPFVADWAEFKERTGFKHTLIEKPLFDSLYGFCGTPDRRGYFYKPLTCGDEGNVILDLKTYPGGQAPWWTRYQLAAYGRLIDPKRIFHRFAVVLTGKGPNVQDYPTEDYIQDTNDFLACVAVARLKLKYE